MSAFHVFAPGDVVIDEQEAVVGIVTETRQRGLTVVWEDGGRAAGPGLLSIIRHREPRARVDVPPGALGNRGRAPLPRRGAVGAGRSRGRSLPAGLAMIHGDQLLHILQHALGRNEYGKSQRGDYRNHVCAGDGSADFVTCRDAVARGLMREHASREISGGDHIFTVTDAGKTYIAANSPPEPRLTRGQRRYREWVAADCGITFGEWLRGPSGGRLR
jgi:hypothetical protein